MHTVVLQHRSIILTRQYFHVCRKRQQLSNMIYLKQIFKNITNSSHAHSRHSYSKFVTWQCLVLCITQVTSIVAYINVFLVSYGQFSSLQSYHISLYSNNKVSYTIQSIMFYILVITYDSFFVKQVHVKHARHAKMSDNSFMQSTGLISVVMTINQTNDEYNDNDIV